MRKPSRFIAILLPVLIVVVVAGGWAAAAAAITAAIEGWARQQRAQGIEVTWRSLDMAGFPVRLTGAMEGAEVTGVTDDVTWSWVPPALSMRFFPLTPRLVEVDAPGRHAIKVDAGPTSADLVASADVATSRVNVSREGIADALLLALENIEVVDNVSGLHLAAGRADLNAELTVRGATPALISRGQIVDLRLPPEPAQPLGNTLPFVAFDTALLGALPANPTAADAARWRDADGRLDVRSLDVVWGPLRAVGRGRLTLDADLQPTGEILARISGLEEALQVFEQAGLLEPNAASLARLAIFALADRAGDGKPTVELPLTIEQRQVSLGPLPLLILPRVQWPAP